MIPANSSKLASWHRRTVEWTLIVLAISGLVWMAGYYALQAMPDMDGPEARSALHILVMTHGIVAYLSAIAVGSLLGRHVPAGLAARRKLKTGIAGLALGGALVLTALLLYYAGDESARELSSIAHQIAGALAVVLVSAHVAHKAKQASETPASQTPSSDQ